MKIFDFLLIVLLFVLVVLAVPALADDTYSAKVHSNGPDALVVESGGSLDIAAGGAFKIAGTQVTSDAAELNRLDGVTATAAQLNFLSGVTAGTSAASKAVVLDAQGKIDTIDLTAVKIGGVAKTDALADAVESPVAGATDGVKLAGGSYTVVADDDTAGTKTIATGITIGAPIVQILRAGVDVTADAVITFAAGNLTIADGAATYDLTADDVINWIAVGS